MEGYRVETNTRIIIAKSKDLVFEITPHTHLRVKWMPQIQASDTIQQVVVFLMHIM